MTKNSQKFLLLWLGILFPLLNLSPVFAEIDEQTLNMYSQNNILFYDSSESDCASAGSNSFCAPIDSSQITWIGDSYSGIGESAVRAQFPNADFGPEPYNSSNSFVMSGKFIDSTYSNNPSGLSILQNIVDGNYPGHTLRPFLVFELGTNSNYANSSESSKTKMQENIDAVLNLVDDDTKVMFVTAYTASWHGGNYEKQNEAIKETAASNPNVYVADWAAVANDSYYTQDPQGIHPANHYEEWAQVIADAMPSGDCSAGLLAGDTNVEKIWNYFVQANIDGVSNNAATIAGIIGNLMQESGANPFSPGGLYGDKSNALQTNVAAAGLGQYWGSSNAPQDAIDRALTIELDYLTQENERFLGTGWAESWGFLKSLNTVDNNTPEAYSDLFEVTVEGAVTGNTISPYTNESNYIEDSGARHIGNTIFGGNPGGGSYYQEAGTRRKYARQVYDQYASTANASAAASAAATNNASLTASASSGGYTKYELTDAQLWDLAEVAVSENGVNMTAFKNELSIMANIFEDPARGHTITGTNLVHFISLPIGGGGWFSTHDYINGSHDLNITSEQLEAARDILINGNRTLPLEIVEHDCILCSAGLNYAYNDDDRSINLINDYDQWISGKTLLVQGSGGLTGSWIFYGWTGGETGVGDPMGYYASRPPSSTPTSSSNSADVCEASSSIASGPGGQDIAEAAAKMAWPVQIGQGDDAHAGMCATDSSYTNWVSYSDNASDCYSNPRQLYREQKDSHGIGTSGEYRDCGWFVASIIYYLGLDDGGFPKGGTSNMLSWMSSQPEHWTEIPNTPDANLQPGDILVSNQHILVWVGEYGGDYGPWIDASLGTRVGIVNNYYSADSGGYHYGDDYWRIFRRNSTDTTIGEDGLTYEQAISFMKNYGANKNNISSNTVGAGLWHSNYYSETQNCGSNCVTFSAFFLYGFTPYRTAYFGNGDQTARNIANDTGLSIDGNASVFSIFSLGYGHTGVVLGHHNGEWIVGHANYYFKGCGAGNGGEGLTRIPSTKSSGDTMASTGAGAGFAIKSTNIDTAIGGSGGVFVHLDNVDTAKISQFIKTGEF